MTTTERTLEELRKALKRREFAKCEAIAYILGMSGSTLRRKLAEEGTCFTRLLSQTRRERLLELPRNWPCKCYGYEMGFMGRESFSRWFSREFGCSPRNSRGIFT
jgi:AraC-like DNA-binding protein